MGNCSRTVCCPAFLSREEYGGLLHERAPHLETLNQAIGENSIDNINMNRLIDFQINCSLLCTAEWRLLHNQTTIPFILSDLGYALFKPNDMGMARVEDTLSRCLKH